MSFLEGPVVESEAVGDFARVMRPVALQAAPLASGARGAGPGNLRPGGGEDGGGTGGGGGGPAEPQAGGREERAGTARPDAGQAAPRAAGKAGDPPHRGRVPDGTRDREARRHVDEAGPGNRQAQEGIQPGGRGPEYRPRPPRETPVEGDDMTIQRAITQSTQSATLADLLERILDKGIVIAGDIKIKLVEVELLTIQLRLVICSVDKAKEMGMDWWVNNPAFDRHAKPELNGDHLGELEKRLAALEAASARTLAPAAS